MVEISAWACSMVTPGFRTAYPSIQRAPRVFELVASGFEDFFHRCGDPELERVADEGSQETFGRDADDRMLHTIEELCPADDIRIAMVAILPGLIADHRSRMGVATYVVAAFEEASHHRADAERLEVVCRNNAAGSALGTVADRERGPENPIRDQSIKQRAVLLEIQEVRPGETGAAVPVGSSEGDHPILIPDERIRAQQDSFDPAEHRGGCANAECETEDSKQ